MSRGAKFVMEERVFHNGKQYFVTGIKMRIGYDVLAWEYWLSATVYGDYPPSAFGARCDVTTLGPLREEQIQTVSEWSIEREKYLIDRKAELETEITALLKEKESLK